MNSLDLYIIIPVALGFLIGLFRGLVKEVISLIIIIAGIYLSKLFAPLLANWIVGIFDISLKAAQPLSFILVFVLIAIVLIIIGKIIHKMIKVLSLGFFNALLGGLFGAVKFALIVSIILIVTDALDEKLSFFENDVREKSIFYEPAIKIAPDLWKEFQENID